MDGWSTASPREIGNDGMQRKGSELKKLKEK